jgi:hypothetical protein
VVCDTSLERESLRWHRAGSALISQAAVSPIGRKKGLPRRFAKKVCQERAANGGLQCIPAKTLKE